MASSDKDRVVEELNCQRPQVPVRPNSKFLDGILGQQFPVLDNGFVRVVDYMGNDSSVVQAARVSLGDGTKTVSEDRTLIRFLMRSRHTTPFEQCSIKFHVRAPLYVWAQWIRQRTAKVNQLSGRYSELPQDKHATEIDCWRRQSSNMKQGSEGFLPALPLEGTIAGGLHSGSNLSREEKELHELSDRIYRRRLDAGVSREQARKDLPVSNYTEAYWKIDLHNLLNFLRQRLDPHAQLEIRQFAKAIAEIVKGWVPYTWEAFNDYQFKAFTFSAQEIKVIKGAISRSSRNKGFMSEELAKLGVSKREIKAFLETIS